MKQHLEIPLWPLRDPRATNPLTSPQEMPNSNGIVVTESVTTEKHILDVTCPSMSIYQTQGEAPSGAIIICPGGGYHLLAIQHEGHAVASWLQENGLTAIVLKYRLPNGNREVPISDLYQAINVIRSKARELNIDPEKVGVMGFSAGGHLAELISAGIVCQSVPATRPNFTVIFYPVISLYTSFGHRWSAEKLLGQSCTQQDLEKYSPELHITDKHPPTIIFHSDDDDGVAPENSTLLYNALKAKKIPASLYVFPSGGHGWGMNNSFTYHETWKSLLLSWLTQQNFLLQNLERR